MLCRGTRLLECVASRRAAGVMCNGMCWNVVERGHYVDIGGHLWASVRLRVHTYKITTTQLQSRRRTIITYIRCHLEVTCRSCR